MADDGSRVQRRLTRASARAQGLQPEQGPLPVPRQRPDRASESAAATLERVGESSETEEPPAKRPKTKDDDADENVDPGEGDVAEDEDDVAEDVAGHANLKKKLAKDPTSSRSAYRRDKKGIGPRSGSEKTAFTKRNLEDNFASLTSLTTGISWPVIENVAMLANVKNYDAIKDSVRLSRIQEPTPAVEPTPAISIFDKPVQPGRDYVPKWLFNKPGNKFKTNTYKKDKIHTRHIFPSKDCSAADAAKIVEKLCEVYNKWPHPLDKGEAVIQAHKAFMLWTAICGALPGRSRTLPAAPVLQGKPREAYTARTTFFNQETGQLVTKTINLSAKVVADVVVPEVPPWVTFSTEGSEKLKQSFSGADQERNTRTYKLVKYLLWRTYYNIFPSIAAFEFFCLNIRRSFMKGNQVRRRAGPYGGRSLAKIQRHLANHVTNIAPRQAVKKDIEVIGERKFAHILPAITVRSLNFAHAAAVVETMEQAFVAGKDILKVWLIGCQAADERNVAISGGRAMTVMCDCSMAEHEFVRHACGLCGGLALCSTLQWLPAFDIRGCPACYSNYQTKLSGRSSSLFQRLQEYHGSETRLLGISATERSKEMDLIINSKAEFVNHEEASSTGLTDDYAPDQKRRFQVPFWLYGNRVRIHCLGNLAITALVFNFAKHTWPPGLLQLLKEWVLRGPSGPEATRILNQIDKLYEISLKRAKRKITRLGERVSNQQFSRMLREWRTGVVAPGSKKWARHLGNWLGNYATTFGPDWKPKGYNQIIGCLKSIENHWRSTGRSIYWYNDCPVICHPRYKPDDYNWGTLWRFLGAKVLAMYLRCNGDHNQVDTIETQLLECIWQQLEGTKTLFDLPLNVRERSPLCMAIAKVTHGRQMRTCWLCEPEREPASVDDRDDSLNNILFMTQVENFMEHDFANNESDREAMRERIKEINLSKTYWDPPDDTTQAQADVAPATAAEPGMVEDDADDFLDEPVDMRAQVITAAIEQLRAESVLQDDDDDEGDEGDEERNEQIGVQDDDDNEGDEEGNEQIGVQDDDDNEEDEERNEQIEVQDDDDNE